MVPLRGVGEPSDVMLKLIVIDGGVERVSR
jgi:hypothetical protein